jgi:hypothetical protein
MLLTRIRRLRGRQPTAGLLAAAALLAGPAAGQEEGILAPPVAAVARPDGPPCSGPGWVVHDDGVPDNGVGWDPAVVGDGVYVEDGFESGDTSSWSATVP